MQRLLGAAGIALIAWGFSTQAMGQACGSHADDMIMTDRPQFTNTAVVVPCGSLQFENGYSATEYSGQWASDFPETMARFGVTSNTELRFGAPDYYNHLPVSGGATNGFGDLSAGLKQQLGPVRGLDISVIGMVSMPTGSKYISSHGYDPTVQVPMSYALSKNWTMNAMLAWMWPTEGTRRNSTGEVSGYLDRQLKTKWDAYVEYAGFFPQRGSPEHVIDVGAAFRITPQQQLDFRCDFGLSAAAPDHVIGVGYSFRLQAIHAR
jgi:hypothetical protein